MPTKQFLKIYFDFYDCKLNGIEFIIIEYLFTIFY